MQIFWCASFSFLMGFYYVLGQNQVKIDSLNTILKEATETNNRQLLVDVYFAKGDTFYNNQNFVNAIPYFLKIDSLSKNFNIRNANTIEAILRRAEILKLSFTYETTNMAHDLLYVALAEAKEINAVESEHLAYIQLADINQMIGEFEEAKKYIDLALPYFKKQDNIRRLSRLLLIKTAYYNGVDSLNKSEDTFLENIAYLKAKNQTLEEANATYYYSSFLRRKKNDCEKALKQLEIAKQLFQKIEKDSIELYHRNLRDLAFCNHQLGNYKEASEYYQAAYDLKIDLLEKFNRSNSKTIEARYQNEEKVKEIKLLNTEKALIEQQKNNLRNQLLGGIGITSIAGLFFFLLYRNRKKTSDKLKELDKVKSHFFANISHEFRTPLTLISHPIEAALEETGLSSEKRSHFEMASRNTKRLLLLIDQLLDLSKIDSGALTLHLEKGSPTLLLAAISESFSYLAKQKNINFTISDRNKSEQGWYDRDALEKIAVNILGNAIKYTPENGRIEVAISTSSAQVNFEVRNTGKGLSKQQMKTIFERFYQTDGFNDGAGIGLSLVKELTQLHKGSISVDREQDEWTVFKVQLSVDKSKFKNADLITSSIEHESAIPIPLPSKVSKEDEELEENGLPILLIVEDNLDVQVLLNDMFKTTYKVFIANNGQDGISIAIEVIPDIIVSDVMMPVKDGVELTNTLKKDERTSHIPIVLLTAKAGDKNKLAGIDVGADDYITKPFNQQILRSKMDNLIALRKKLRSRYSQEVILKPKDIAITSVDEQFLERVQKVLDQKLVDSSFTIDAFSEAVHMSRMQLHRKLKALTGLSASEFIRSQRLKLATGILKKSDINISEIGYRVGFNDPAYFAKCFKEAYNCTPSQFVNQ